MAPEKLYSVTSIAIPYLKHAGSGVARYPSQLLYSWYMNFFQLRGVADWALSVGDWRFIRWLWQHWSPDWEAPHEVMESVAETFSQSGVKRAALGYYRCMFRLFTARGRQSQALLRRKIPVPALLITGENDGCIRTELFETTVRPEDFPGGYAIERVGGAGHFVHLERPGAVNQALLNHLKTARESVD